MFSIIVFAGVCRYLRIHNEARTFLYVLNVSYTVNGFNLKYKIEDTSLKVGETMKITIDSEN